MNQDGLFGEYKGVWETEDSRDQTSEKKKEKIFGYNPFTLQDAIGEKNVKKIWIEYEKLRSIGIEPEGLIYTIISKVRNMTAIKRGANKESLDVNDYPYNKSKRDARNWEEKDLEDFYTKLIEIYHRSRIDGGDLGTAIEKTLLSI